MPIEFFKRNIHRCGILMFMLFYLVPGIAQDKIDIAYIDSLSYEQYVRGEWDELLQTGQLAEKEGIDFLYLRQRLGYANFMKKRYYKSIQHYVKAAKHGESEITQLYLYYNALQTGKTAYARYYVSKLSKESLGNLQVSKFKVLNAADLEYSYKTPSAAGIHDASYQRIGLNSLLGYKFNLYQSVSHFGQSTDSTSTQQFEYYALAGWTPLPKTHINLAYHFVDAKVNYEDYTYSFPGHVLFGKLSHQLYRFDLAASGGYYMSERLNSGQIGLHLGVNFTGNIPVTLTSSLYQIMERDQILGQTDRQIFKQTIGFMPYKNIWTESFINFGNLNYFIDTNALYIYNPLDPTVFRTGTSIFYYICKPLNVYLNYTYDQKQTYNTTQTYHQHSITGGLIWQF